MGIYISELRVFYNNDEDATFLGAILASDEGSKGLTSFMKKLVGIKRSDSREKHSSSAIDAYYMHSEIMPYYIITLGCKRSALKIGARSLPMAQLINKCSDGKYEEAWSEISSFCV